MFVPQGAVLWRVGLVMGVANLVGGYLGARTAVARGARFVRIFFIVVCRHSSSGSAATWLGSGVNPAGYGPAVAKVRADGTRYSPDVAKVVDAVDRFQRRHPRTSVPLR